MSIYRIQLPDSPDPRSSASWFDGGSSTWDDPRLRSHRPLIHEWAPKRFRLNDPRGPTDVLYNPNAWAVCPRIQESLSNLSGAELLPVDVRGAGPYFILHITGVCPLPAGAEHRRAPPPSGNIVDISSLPKDFEAPFDFFRVAQPPDSAASRVHGCYLTVFLSRRAADALNATCSAFMATPVVPQTRNHA